MPILGILVRKTSREDKKLLPVCRLKSTTTNLVDFFFFFVTTFTFSYFPFPQHSNEYYNVYLEVVKAKLMLLRLEQAPLS